MKFYENVVQDLNLTKLARFLEDQDVNATGPGHVYAAQVRDLRDRLVRGMPVAASDMDIEQFVAVDILKQAREITKCPEERGLLHHLEELTRMVNGVQELKKGDKP